MGSSRRSSNQARGAPRGGLARDQAGRLAGRLEAALRVAVHVLHRGLELLEAQAALELLALAARPRPRRPGRRGRPRRARSRAPRARAGPRGPRRSPGSLRSAARARALDLARRGGVQGESSSRACCMAGPARARGLPLASRAFVKASIGPGRVAVRDQRARVDRPDAAVVGERAPWRSRPRGPPPPGGRCPRRTVSRATATSAFPGAISRADEEQVGGAARPAAARCRGPTLALREAREGLLRPRHAALHARRRTGRPRSSRRASSSVPTVEDAPRGRREDAVARGAVRDHALEARRERVAQVGEDRLLLLPRVVELREADLREAQLEAGPVVRRGRPFGREQAAERVAVEQDAAQEVLGAPDAGRARARRPRASPRARVRQRADVDRRLGREADEDHLVVVAAAPTSSGRRRTSSSSAVWNSSRDMLKMLSHCANTPPGRSALRARR